MLRKPGHLLAERDQQKPALTKRNRAAGAARTAVAGRPSLLIHQSNPMG